MKSSKPSFLFLAMVMSLANLINREAADAIEYLLEYNKILKSKLEKDNKRIRFTPTERARLARKGTKCSRKILNRFSELLSPKTLFRWRDWYIAKKYTQKKPPKWSEVVETRECVRRLVCKFASENPMWGAGRIVGALKQLGIKRTKTTVYKIMLSNGFDPNPEGKNFRVNRLWLDFIKRHLNLMVGADFFTVEVFTLRGIIRYLVFFVIDCATKKVKIIHVSHTFDGDKMATLGRQMTDCFDGVLKNKKYFFCDKDVLYTQKFRDILKNSGIKVKQVPNPICNPYAERFVKSIKRECTDNFIFFSEQMLIRAVKEYEKYYNSERPHQSIENNLISPESNEHWDYLEKAKNINNFRLSELNSNGIVKSERLGGLLKSYYRRCG